MIVNTVGSGGGPGAAAPDRAEVDGPSDGELLGRAARIAAVLAKHQLRNVFERDRGREVPDAMRARRFRSALEELGPTFAKLGQILSTRPDLLPPAVTRELATLQDDVTPLTEAEGRVRDGAGAKGPLGGRV